MTVARAQPIQRAAAAAACAILLCTRAAFACDEDPARRGVDHLVRGEIEPAAAAFDAWGAREPEHPLLPFYRATVRLGAVEVASAATKSAAEATATAALEGVVARSRRELAATPGQPQWRLSLGLAQAFLARLYMKQKKWFDAYRNGRAARDGLAELVTAHPELEDAYLVLGLFEYHTGSVPAGLKWLIALLDFSGDRELGIRYLERATQHARAAAPEAARVLLREVKLPAPRACDYLPLARRMREDYAPNPQFSLALQQLYVTCGQPRAALAEHRRALRDYAARYAKYRTAFEKLALAIHRDLGDADAVEAVDTDAVQHRALAQAQALDVAGARAEAVTIYRWLSDAEEAPHDVKERALLHLDKPYRAPALRQATKDIVLKPACS